LSPSKYETTTLLHAATSCNNNNIEHGLPSSERECKVRAWQKRGSEQGGTRAKANTTRRNFVCCFGTPKMFAALVPAGNCPAHIPPPTSHNSQSTIPNTSLLIPQSLHNELVIKTLSQQPRNYNYN